MLSIIALLGIIIELGLFYIFHLKTKLKQALRKTGNQLQALHELSIELECCNSNRIYSFNKNCEFEAIITVLKDNLKNKYIRQGSKFVKI